MKAAVFLGPENIEVQDIPVPECGAHELLLRVEITDICGTDVKTYFQGGRNSLQPPQVIGHKIVDTVVKVGSKSRWLLRRGPRLSSTGSG